MSRYNSVGSFLLSFPTRSEFASELINRSNRQNALSRKKARVVGTFDDNVLSRREREWAELSSDASFHSSLAWLEGKTATGYVNDGLDDGSDAARAMGINNNNAADFAFIDVLTFLNLINDATVNWVFVEAMVAEAEYRATRAFGMYMDSLHHAHEFESKFDAMEDMLP